MTTATDTYTLLRAFVDELARCGLRDACTSPGSRCTPLVLSLAREPRLRCHSHIDERCAGFFAVGLAKATGAPVAVTCTSGTAVAELLPAAIEAHEAGVPLLILTADRPPELRENGAGQTIDQVKIFGGPRSGSSRWARTTSSARAAALDAHARVPRVLACAARAAPAWCTSTSRCASRWSSDEPLPARRQRAPRRPSARDLHARARRRRPRSARSLAVPVAAARRGVVVAGRYERDTALGEAAAAFCAAAGWPLLADPLSGARRGAAAVAHYDALLRHGPFAAARRAGHRAARRRPAHVQAAARVARRHARRPAGRARPGGPLAGSRRGRCADRFALEPAAAFAALAREPAHARRPRVARDAGAARTSAPPRRSLGVLGARAASASPRWPPSSGCCCPQQATLFVASSMPVRDIESFWPVRADPPRVLCNRGANGIDGTVSSAFGAAAGRASGPVGAADRRRGARPRHRRPARRAAPGADADDRADRQRRRRHLRLPAGRRDRGEDLYTRHIATPTGLDFAHAARLYGLEHESVTDVLAFRAALERALTRAPAARRDHRSAHRPRRERGAAPPRVGGRRRGRWTEEPERARAEPSKADVILAYLLWHRARRTAPSALSPGPEYLPSLRGDPARLPSGWRAQAVERELLWTSSASEQR